MEELIDLMVTKDSSASDVSDKIKDILLSKSAERIDAFKPEVILVSAGFDAHYRDPLAQINLESKE